MWPVIVAAHSAKLLSSHSPRVASQAHSSKSSGAGAKCAHDGTQPLVQVGDELSLAALAHTSAVAILRLMSADASQHHAR